MSRKHQFLSESSESSDFDTFDSLRARQQQPQPQNSQQDDVYSQIITDEDRRTMNLGVQLATPVVRHTVERDDGSGTRIPPAGRGTLVMETTTGAKLTYCFVTKRLTIVGGGHNLNFRVSQCNFR
jgi:hypothetical protein